MVNEHHHHHAHSHTEGHPTHEEGHGGHLEHEGHDHSGMAVSAVLHCLTGCAIGEISGMMIGMGMGLSSIATIAISIVLAFIFGYILSAVPLVRNGVPAKKAFKLVLLADTLSILSMEVAENLFMGVMPGAMSSGLGNPMFWVYMSISFVIGFIVAYPVNKALLKRGKGHAITHMASGHQSMDNKPLMFGLVAFLLGGFITALLG